MASAEDILKAGWLEKEYASRSWFKHRPRYVVLTTLNLKYYYQQSDAYDEDNMENARQDIPLVTVNDAAVLDHGTREPEIVHIETASRTWRFKAPNVAEAEQWRQAIFGARNRLGMSRVHFGTLPGGRPLSAVRETEEDEDDVVATNPLDDIWTTCQANEELINALENVSCSAVDKAKYAANMFFDGVALMPSKERAVRAKEMGRALVAWVGEGTDRVGSGYDSCLKQDAFAMWIRIALSREFLASCKFDESANESGNADEDASSESSNMTHSTIKSRMKNLRVGTIIMPFRADTAECLFISSIIHASALKFNFLRSLLHGSLRPVALGPDLFTIPRNLPFDPSGTGQHGLVAPPIAGQHHHASVHSSSSLSMAVPPLAPGNKEGTVRESLSRQSSRFLGLFRNVFNRNAGAGTGRPSSLSVEDRPMSVDAANRPTSAMLNSYLYLINAKSTQSQEAAAAALNELALLTPLDLKRLEVRKRLQDCAMSIVQRFEELRDHFPASIVAILNTIRDLIIVTQPTDSESPSSGPTGGEAEVSRESESELYRNRRRFEFGTYFTSCSALLFLRLICRAIISPDEYGVTKYVTVHNTGAARASRRVSKVPDGSPSSCDGTVGGTPMKEGQRFMFPRAVSPMLLLAHTIAYEPPGENPHKHRRELLENRYAAEMLSLARNLSKQMPADAANKCTEAMEDVYLSSGVVADIRAEAEEHYLFDFSKPVTRWALAEVAKTVQHIANVSCLPSEEMQAFAKDSLIRQNIGAGKQDKDSYDTYVLTGYENEAINVQVDLATHMKKVYEQVGVLGDSKW